MVEQVIRKHIDNKNIISILQTIQERFGYIPEREAKIIAKKLNVPLVELYGVITFYSQFKLKPDGKYVIRVCKGTACHIHNSGQLINLLKEKLKINAGETTEDGLFTLELVNCLGACARAPVIMVNDEVFGNMTEKKLENLIEKLKKENNSAKGE